MTFTGIFLDLLSEIGVCVMVAVPLPYVVSRPDRLHFLDDQLHMLTRCNAYLIVLADSDQFLQADEAIHR